MAERALVLQRHSDALKSAESGSNTSDGGAAAVAPAADQYLMLLVPSASVDWGRMSEGMGSSFNSTAGSSNSGTGNTQPSEGWLEIGCQVMHARLVQGVSFAV